MALPRPSISIVDSASNNLSASTANFFNLIKRLFSNRIFIHSSGNGNESAIKKDITIYVYTYKRETYNSWHCFNLKLHPSKAKTATFYDTTNSRFFKTIKKHRPLPPLRYFTLIPYFPPHDFHDHPRQINLRYTVFFIPGTNPITHSLIENGWFG